MAGKKGSAVSAVAAAAAAYGARKLLAAGWRQVTGNDPPDHPEDPQVALTEALIWGAMVGVVVQTARMLAVRATSRRKKSGRAPG
jgi:predicted amidohydrolase YtcJ